MPNVRYVRSAEDLARAVAARAVALPSQVKTLRAYYETDPHVARVVVPRPLETVDAPLVYVTVSQVSIQVSPERTIQLGSATFGVRARFEGRDGTYFLTMPMSAESAVLSGREVYGEPKKLAAIELVRDGSHVTAKVTRMGVTYLELRGEVGDSIGSRELIEHGWCFKVWPSPERGDSFDADPVLVQLDWEHRHAQVAKVAGDVILRDSPFDPVADLPVRRVARMEWDEGRTESRGRVLRTIPGEWLAPFAHQRYDDPGVRGIEV